MNHVPERDPGRHPEWRIFPAAAVVVIGVLFLLGNLGYRLDFLYHSNGWAWFILLAAVTPLTRAYALVRTRGRPDREVLRHLTSAAFIVLVAAMFLLELDWGVWWPLFVILGGVSMLGRGPHCYRHMGWSKADPGSDR